MKRLFLIPALASLLAGCVYGEYAYRGDGRGDYYYGRPSVDYRYYGGYYGGYYGYPYGYPYYGGYYRYGYPYGYGYPGYGYPYGGYYRPYYRSHPHSHHPYRPYRPPVIVKPDPSHPGSPAPHPGRRPGPWQVLDGLDRAPGNAVPGAQPRQVAPRSSVAPRERGNSSSPIGTLMRGVGEPRRRHGESAAQQEP